MIYKATMLTVMQHRIVTVILRAICPFIAVKETGFVGAVVTGGLTGAFFEC